MTTPSTPLGRIRRRATWGMLGLGAGGVAKLLVGVWLCAS